MKCSLDFLVVPRWALLAALAVPLLLAAATAPAHARFADDGFNPAADGPVFAVAVQADGRILVGGNFTTLGGQPRAYIGRLNADGSLDTTFNPGADGIVSALAVQPDDKILVGGDRFSTLGGQPRENIGRLNPDGSVDMAFNPGAMVGSINTLAVQWDGRIVVGGFFISLGGQPRDNIGRLNADGSVDTTFNPGADADVNTVAVQSDGKIVVGGEYFTTLGGQPRSAIGRLNADGSVDTTFNPGADGGVNSLAVQANGKIVVGGFFTTLGGQPRDSLGRLNADGGVDTTFNPAVEYIVAALAVQPDGKIVVGGYFERLAGQPRDNIGRLNADGSLDTAFNPGADSGVQALALQPDGEIVVAGEFTVLGGLPRLHIGRLNADGTLDLGSSLAVKLDGPARFDPGSVEEYSVAFSNGSAQTVENAVLVVALPGLADYLDNSGGGILWEQRGQLFWRLGTLAPGSLGLFSFRVRFSWGIPLDTRDMAVAVLSGANLDPEGFDVRPYLDYAPATVVEERQLTAAEVEAERQAYPELNLLYGQATQEGFAFGTARSRTPGTGEAMTEIVLLRFQPRLTAMLLRRQGASAQATLVDSSSFVVRSALGALSFNLKTDEWETAIDGAGVASLGSQAAAASVSDCVLNCVIELVPKTVIKKVVKEVSTVSKGVTCFKAASLDPVAMAKCSNTLITKLSWGGEAIEVTNCYVECSKDPDSHYCTKDLTYCDAGGFPYGWFGIDSIVVCKCITDPATGRAGQYMACETVKVCAICEKCVDAGGGPVCTVPGAAGGTVSATTARLDAALGISSSICSTCRPAHDPNAKYGAEGDVFAGQPITYRITFENEGAGEAFDVFVVDKLGEHLDTSTLTIHDGGELIAASRTLVWQVGELAPKGQPGSTGEVSFTVNLKPDLPSGTVVVNQAVVHFPSVPEETPTNPVINVVQPIAAIPQAVETLAGQAVAIQLQGRSASGVSLTYAIVEPPLNGELSGTPPSLTYTPAEDMTGLDHLRFTVSDGVATSRPGEVQIIVRPAANDATPPRVVWTSPAHREFVAEIGAAPRFTDAIGPLYLPPVRIEFSEAMSTATVSTATIQMRDASGRVVPLGVSYDGLLNQAMVLPRERLRPGMLYTVTVTSGVEDLGGNALVAPHTFTFQAGSRLRSRLYPAGSLAP